MMTRKILIIILLFVYCHNGSALPIPVPHDYGRFCNICLGPPPEDCTLQYCNCPSGYNMDTGSRKCVPEIQSNVQYGENCDYSHTCNTKYTCIGLDVRMDARCGCRPGYYYDVGGSNCLPKKSEGESCTSSNQCLSIFLCQSGRCCPDDHYYDSTCKPKKNPNDACSDTVQCVNNLSCISGVCGCTVNQYVDDSSCKPKRSYSQECDPAISSVCSSPENVCIPDITGKHRCLCGVSDYSRSGVCHPLSEMQVANFQVQSNDPTQVRFTWTADDYGQQVNYTYKMQWNTTIGLMDTGEKTAGKDGLLVSNLTSGRQYTFSIISRLAGDGYYYAEKRTEVERTVDMLPAQPGPIVQNTSMLDSPPYNLTFQPSEGDVAKYKIILKVVENSTFAEVIEAEEPRVENLDLPSGKVYFYTIIAFNKKGEITEPVLGSFSAGPFVEDNDDDDEDNIKLPIVAGVAGATLALVAIIIVIILIIVVVVRKRKNVDNTRSFQSEVEQLQNGSNISILSYASSDDTEPYYDDLYKETMYNKAYQDGFRNYLFSQSDEKGNYEYNKQTQKTDHRSNENVLAECSC